MVRLKGQSECTDDALEMLRKLGSNVEVPSTLRLWAMGLIDQVGALGTSYGVLWVAYFVATGDDLQNLRGWWVLVLLVLALVIYVGFYAVSAKVVGRTPGMVICGIWLVNAKGSLVDWKSASLINLYRNLAPWTFPRWWWRVVRSGTLPPEEPFYAVRFAPRIRLSSRGRKK